MQSSSTFPRLQKEESVSLLPREGTQGSTGLGHLPQKHSSWDEERLSGAGERAQLVKVLLFKHESLESSIQTSCEEAAVRNTLFTLALGQQRQLDL